MVSFHSMTSDLRVCIVGWGERSKSSTSSKSSIFMPPTLKKWGGILVSACPYVCMYVRTYVFMFEISS